MMHPTTTAFVTRNVVNAMPLVVDLISHDTSEVTLPTAVMADTRLHVIDGADHSFHVLKRSGRTDDEVLDELAEAIGVFVG